MTIKCENQISKMSNLIFLCDNHGFAFSSLHLAKLFTFEKTIKNETHSMAFKAFQIIRCKHTAAADIHWAESDWMNEEGRKRFFKLFSSSPPFCRVLCLKQNRKNGSVVVGKT